MQKRPQEWGEPLYTWFSRLSFQDRDLRFETKTKMSAKVTVEDVERVAELAHLKLAPDEVGPMLRDLNAILDYIAELNELDTSNVLPLAQVSEIASDAVPALRADQLVPSLDRAVVMAQAPETDGVFFKVPKVIER
jgi:aspartyl-tRNA(Asn)/glutamyl-tRNA(Gln) amidotransferase subunit C